jgi:hypothetical protein
MLNVVMLNAVMLNTMVQLQISFFKVNTKHSRGIEAKYLQYWTRLKYFGDEQNGTVQNQNETKIKTIKF